MQLRLATVVTVASFTASTLAQILSFEGFANNVSCSGSAFGCVSSGAVCCSLPTGFGFTAQFQNLPSGTQGQGYADNSCSSFLFVLFGPGTKCFIGNGTRATSLNWFHSPQGARAVYAREAEATDANCSAPAYFKYEDATGIEKKIKVPAGGGEAQTIADLYLTGNLAVLSIYEDY